MLKLHKKTFKKIISDENGNSAISGTMISIVTVAIVIGMTGMIISNIQPYIKGNSNEANASITAVFDTTWSALGMAPIVMIVMVAALVIGAVYALRS